MSVINTEITKKKREERRKIKKETEKELKYFEDKIKEREDEVGQTIKKRSNSIMSEIKIDPK